METETDKKLDLFSEWYQQFDHHEAIVDGGLLPQMVTIMNPDARYKELVDLLRGTARLVDSIEQQQKQRSPLVLLDKVDVHQVMIRAIETQPEGYRCREWTRDWMKRIIKWIMGPFSRQMHPDKHPLGSLENERGKEWFVAGQFIRGLMNDCIDCTFRLEELEVEMQQHKLRMETFLLDSSHLAYTQPQSQFSSFEYDFWSMDAINTSFSSSIPIPTAPPEQETIHPVYTTPSTPSIPSNEGSNGGDSSGSSSSTLVDEEEIEEKKYSLRLARKRKVVEEHKVEENIKDKYRSVKSRLVNNEACVYTMKMDINDGPSRDIWQAMTDVLASQPDMWHSRTDFLSSSDKKNTMPRLFLEKMDVACKNSKHKSYSLTVRSSTIKLIDFCRRKLDVMCDDAMSTFATATVTTESIDTSTPTATASPEGVVSTKLLIKRKPNDKGWLFKLLLLKKTD